MASHAEKPNDDGGALEDVKTNNVPGSGTTDIKPLPSSPASLKPSSTIPKAPNLSSSSSTANSLRPSREGSPTRPPLKPGIKTASQVTRSRKNSQDLSPIANSTVSTTSIPTVPSAAAIQRALSATGTPHLPAPAKQESAPDTPQPQKTGKPSVGKIPRLSSPPPAASSGSNKSVLNAARKFDQVQSQPTTPSIIVDRPARSTTSLSDSDAGDDDRSIKSGMKTPVRGASGSGPVLETVQESSIPSTPAITGGPSGHAVKRTSNNDRPERIEENPMEEAFGKEAHSRNESGNESAGKKVVDVKGSEEGKETKKPATAPNSAKPAAAVTSKRSFTQLPLTKASKTAAEGSVKNMTVETETVSSIPQVSLGGGLNERGHIGRTDTGGSVRLKPSNETIRPKKEKKKVVRKAPSLNAGNGGFSTRYLHHRPKLARPPSFESLISLPVSPPGSAYDHMLEQRQVQSALLPGNRKDQDGKRFRPSITPANPRGTRRRSSSSVLIPFLGRTASTKADIFEAKIATAVDEANSSDSEETFVYESNPPEPHSARPHRFHSRTPSATSTVSHYDNHGMKNRPDGHHTIVGKKSMKFANNYNSIGYAHDDGTLRGGGHHSRHSTSSTPHQHHHIGRYGRGGHASLFDSDSPFSNTAKGPQSAAGHLSRLSPRNSPQNSSVIHVTKSPRKAEEIMSYDLEGEGADDERTPLVGTNRARNRRRPLPGSVRQMYADDKTHWCCGRVTAWTTLGVTLTLILAAIVAVVALCSKPLVNVYVKDIRNVLASEQEIMLDLHVRAINPNLVAIQVSNLDVNIFAKSKHVGTNELWRSHRPHVEFPDHPPKPGKARINSHKSPPIFSNPSDNVSRLGGIDEGTDPIDDPATDSQTMLLGQIFEFDSPLVFDPSPIHHHSLGSIGEVRLAKPGNKTEEGGSQRWEHVIQHDFELITRGVIRYSLPVSSKMYSAKIAGRVVVHPTEDVDDAGNMRLSQPTWPFEPGSNVLLDPPDKKKPHLLPT